jgi:hypothetical protein
MQHYIQNSSNLPTHCCENIRSDLHRLGSGANETNPYYCVSNSYERQALDLKAVLPHVGDSAGCQSRLQTAGLAHASIVVQLHFETGLSYFIMNLKW